MRTNRKTPRYVKLELEQLENREAPSVTPWTTLSFEGSQIGSLPLEKQRCQEPKVNKSGKTIL